MMITDLDPGADPRLAAVFSAAAAPAELPVPGEAEALAAYRRSAGKSWFTIRMGARPAQMVAAALFGGVLLAGGVATAASGSLPIVGHHHPAPTAPTAPDEGSQTDAVDSGTADTTSTVDMTDTAGPGTAGHPHAQPTRGSVATGVHTCTAASKGTCRAGQHGKAATAHSTHLPPVAGTRRFWHAALRVELGGRPSWHRGFLSLHAPSAMARYNAPERVRRAA